MRDCQRVHLSDTSHRPSSARLASCLSIRICYVCYACMHRNDRIGCVRCVRLLFPIIGGEVLCGYKFRVRELVRNWTRAPVITGWGGYQNRLTDQITTGSQQVKMAPVLSPRAGNRSGGPVLPVIRAGELVLNSGFKPVRRTGFYEYRTNCI